MLARSLSRDASVLWMQTGMLALSAALALAGFVAGVRFVPQTRFLPASWRGDLGEMYAFALLDDFAATLKHKASDGIGLPLKLALPSLPKPAAPEPLFPAKIPPSTVALIKHLENKRLTAYRDAAGILTIGYGHTGGVAANAVITTRKANILLAQDLRIAQDAVRRQVRVRLNVNEFSALVSLVFNIGEAAFAHSKGLELLNRGMRHAAAKAFLTFNKAKIRGKIVILSGLVRRRRIEKALFLRVPKDSRIHRMVLACKSTSIPDSEPPKPNAPPRTMRAAAIKPDIGLPVDFLLYGHGRRVPQAPPPRRPGDDVALNRTWPVS
jgi:lysozyme